MLVTTLLLLVGLVLLIKGADILVSGASSIATRFGVSHLVIGLTIVAFGTSAPELIVNIIASLNGNTDIAIGNVLGSNIANILLILGISAAIFPLTVTSSTVWKEIPFSLLAVVVVGFLVGDTYIEGLASSGLGRIDGLVLVSFFLIFLYYTFSIAKNGSSEESKNSHTFSNVGSVGRIALGLVALTVGATWVVNGASALASLWGVSEAIIGLTIVAVGTSLPELATSAMAAYRRESDIAVGNIVGSNIFNIFWILGVSAIINPLPFSTVLLRDVGVAIGATVLLFIVMFVGKRHILERWQGIAFIVLYIVYLAALVSFEIF